MSHSLSPKRRGRPPVIDLPETGARIIKKYGNRRLYDTRDSCYVNQELLLELFAEEEELRVVDATSGEDLTERVLAQALLGEDGRGDQPLMPVEVLRALARYRGTKHKALARALTSAVAAFTAKYGRGQGRSARKVRSA